MNPEASIEGPLADELRRAGEFVTATLQPTIADPARWDVPAGGIAWQCRRAAAHVADCLLWYAALLSRHATGPVEVGEMSRDAAPEALIDAIRSGTAVLGAVIEQTPPEVRAWHSFGVADRSGFAAMGCDELLVHGADIAAGLDIDYRPPADLCTAVTTRIFPWAPPGADPWVGLQWANGRAPLGDRPAETEWLWHCAPLAEWDGEVRRHRPPA